VIQIGYVPEYGVWLVAPLGSPHFQSACRSLDPKRGPQLRHVDDESLEAWMLSFQEELKVSWHLSFFCDYVPKIERSALYVSYSDIGNKYPHALSPSPTGLFSLAIPGILCRRLIRNYQKDFATEHLDKNALLLLLAV
jgi:hypothetical protein